MGGKREGKRCACLCEQYARRVCRGECACDKQQVEEIGLEKVAMTLLGGTDGKRKGREREGTKIELLSQCHAMEPCYKQTKTHGVRVVIATLYCIDRQQ